jgi:hypothetical protein
MLRSDEKGVRSISGGRKSGVAPFSSGMNQPSASGLPVGARDKDRTETSILRGILASAYGR